MLNYIAVLGFALSCSKSNQVLAYEAGLRIANLGFGIAAGSLIGTANRAFQGAKVSNGYTLAVVEQEPACTSHTLCDILQVVRDNHLKHQVLAQLCMGAIVIGGGNGTLDLVNCFLDVHKPIVAISGSGGIVSREIQRGKLRHQIAVRPNINAAIGRNLQYWRGVASC